MKPLSLWQNIFFSHLSVVLFISFSSLSFFKCEWIASVLLLSFHLFTCLLNAEGEFSLLHFLNLSDNKIKSTSWCSKCSVKLCAHFKLWIFCQIFDRLRCQLCASILSTTTSLITNLIRLTKVVVLTHLSVFYT